MARENETEVRLVDVASAVRLRLDELPKAERRVGEAVLRDLVSIPERSVGELADAAGTSSATVVRLARRLGFAGFTDFKLALAREAGRASAFGHPDEASGDTDRSALDAILSDEMAALRRVRTSIDYELFGRAVEQLANTSEVCFVGVGTSAYLAQLAAYRFNALGVSASASADTLSQRLRIETLGPDAVVVAVSHSGVSEDTCRMADQATQNGLCVVGITSAGRSPLTELVTISLVTDDGTVGHHLDNFASRTSHAAVLSALHHGTALLLPSAAEAGERSAVIAAAHQR